jgi:nucleoside-diphosphate-sugar epimerase
MHVAALSNDPLGDVNPQVTYNKAFNVGSTDQNYRIRDLARMVEKVVPGSVVALGQGRVRIRATIG